ncbi:MAG TPA: glycoside hydrolase family 20 zincin-like fold domain-containing protein, partial [Sphingobacteriaceae bacterium]
MIKKYIFSALAILFLVNPGIAQVTNPNLGIIPAPKSVRITSGTFRITGETAIMFETESDRRLAEVFHDFLRDQYFLDLPVAKNFIRAPKNVIRFSSIEYNGTNPEGYRLKIDPAQITVSGKGAGLFYGMQSLM